MIIDSSIGRRSVGKRDPCCHDFPYLHLPYPYVVGQSLLKSGLKTVEYFWTVALWSICWYMIYHIPWLCVYNLLMWYCGYTWILYAIFVVYFCVLTPNYCQAVPCLVRNYHVWDPVGTVGAAQTGLFSCSKPITAKKPEWILYRACLWLAFRISDS